MPPETWEKTVLGKYIQVIMGQSPESEYYTSDSTKTPFLQGNRTFGTKYPSFDTYTSKITKLAPSGSVIISVRAPVGDINLTPVDLCLGRGVAALVSNDSDNEFLYYLMKYMAPTLIQNQTGSTFGSINKDDLCQLEILLPDSYSRLRIGELLSSIDNEITILQTINDNLLTLAKAIFYNSLSTENVKVLQLSDICASITDGVHNTVEDDPDGSALLLSCKNIKNGQLIIGNSERTINIATFERLRKRTKLAKGDILLTSVGTIGESLLLMDPPDRIEFQRSVALIKPDTTKVSSEYLYLAINSVKDNIVNTAHGAVQQCLFINDISMIQIPVIDTNSMELTTEKLKPLFSSINENNHKNEALISMRDCILPKLMSGEIDVSAI